MLGGYRKTLPTPISGLPELIFDEGFNKYNSFLAQVELPTATIVPDMVEYEYEKIYTDNLTFLLHVVAS